MSNLIITGQPVCSFEFRGIPSINTYYNKQRWARATATNEWRTEAKYLAQIWMWVNEAPQPVFEERALVVVNVHPYFEEIMDVHNTYVKAILDGFSDAGIWPDDEWSHVPLVLYAWDGNDNQRLRRTGFDIYDLRGYAKGGKMQRLPKGRTRI